MPNTFPITGLIHHLTPEPPSPPSCSCQGKPPFPARVAMAIPACASPPSALHLRWTTAHIAGRALHTRGG